METSAVSMVSALRAHAATEDETSLAWWRERAEFPRGASPEVFAGDHRLLAKACDRGEQILAALPDEAADLRRRVVLVLEPLLQLRRVLEHHTEREQRWLYPALDAELGEEEARRLMSLKLLINN